VKRQFNHIAPVHRRRQKQQATVAGNDVQFASHAETILELKYSASRLGEPESRNAPISVQTGRNAHLLSMLRNPRRAGDYERSCTLRPLLKPSECAAEESPRNRRAIAAVNRIELELRVRVFCLNEKASYYFA
jgi:hypothetical protein